MSINFNQLSLTHQGNQSIRQEDSIANAPKMVARVSNVANTAIAACSQSSSVESLSKEIVFKLYDWYQIEYQELCVKTLREDSRSLKEDITSTIDLVTPLSGALQKQDECTTILDLFRKKFPLLTQSLFNKETKIPRFVVSSLNHESKLNSSLQIQAKGEIAFIAWDSSGSQIVEGFKKHTCDIPFELEKVTVIGILITKLPNPLESLELFNPRAAYKTQYSHSYKGCHCVGKLPYMGRDRKEKIGETLHPFCLEIVPQFSSIQTSNPEIDLLHIKGTIKKRLARSS